jgi:hypothetical protein
MAGWSEILQILLRSPTPPDIFSRRAHKRYVGVASTVMLPSLSGRLGRLPRRSDDHLQPRRAILALALLAQQSALAACSGA